MDAMDTFYWWIPVDNFANEENSSEYNSEGGEVCISVDVDEDINPISATLVLNHTDYDVEDGTPALEALSIIKGWSEEEYKYQLEMAVENHILEECGLGYD